MSEVMILFVKEKVYDMFSLLKGRIEGYKIVEKWFKYLREEF